MGASSFDDFKECAGEYFRLTGNLSDWSFPQVENGHKMLALIYLRSYDEWSKLDRRQGEIIMDLAGSRLMEFEFSEAING